MDSTENLRALSILWIIPCVQNAFTSWVTYTIGRKKHCKAKIRIYLVLFSENNFTQIVHPA